MYLVKRHIRKFTCCLNWLAFQSPVASSMKFRVISFCTVAEGSKECSVCKRKFTSESSTKKHLRAMINLLVTGV